MSAVWVYSGENTGHIKGHINGLINGYINGHINCSGPLCSDKPLACHFCQV